MDTALQAAPLVRLALERGDIDAAQLATLRARGEPLDQALLGAGLIDSAQLHELMTAWVLQTASAREDAIPTQVVGPTQILSPPALSGAPPPTAAALFARRYRDGNVVTASGEVVEADEALHHSAAELPYASAEAQLRMGGYDLLEEIGRGGMGVVYRAYSIRLCRPCAVKVLESFQPVTELDALRFQNEALLAAQLSHPNIASVFDAGEHEGRFFYVMEYVPGRALTELCHAAEDAAVRQGVEALAKVARALEFAHAQGVIHRDLKPDNIQLGDNGQPYILDFGIAVALDLEGSARLGEVIGTPHYMAPEQANAEERSLGPRTDVYGLGATLYHLIAGQPPFAEARGGVFAVLNQVLTRDPLPPRALAQARGLGVPRDLETICLKALEKQAERRYASAAALAEDLEAFLQDRPIQAREVGRLERFRKLVRRNRVAFALSVTVAAVLLLMTVSFGSVVAFNVHESGRALRAQDRQAALDQAGTLERAIRVNMLEGRADLARELVSRLRDDETLNELLVVRTDRSLAYSDLATRERVAERLEQLDAEDGWDEWGQAGRERMNEVRRRGFARIDAQADAQEGPPPTFAYDRQAWGALLFSKQATTERVEREGEPSLLVLKPILNDQECRMCHEGRPGESYADVRAVLAIYRSQRDIERRVQTHRLLTLLVGLVSSALFLLLLLVFVRVFGIRIPRRFGLGPRSESSLTPGSRRA